MIGCRLKSLQHVRKVWVLSFFKKLLPMKAKVWLSLDKPSFAEGEPVVGKVNVESQEFIQADEVRVEARVYENYTEPVWVVVGNRRVQQMQRKKNTLFSRDVRVSGPTDFGSGSRSFPFTVAMPVYRPTRNGGAVENSVKGVVAVKGRPDVTGELQVGFAPPGLFPSMMSPPTFAPAPGYGPGPGYGPAPGYPQMNPGYGAPAPGYGMPPQPAQVVTREIVKVRCKYCNTLMDMSNSTCPNCGAHQ